MVKSYNSNTLATNSYSYKILFYNQIKIITCTILVNKQCLNFFNWRCDSIEKTYCSLDTIVEFYYSS